MNQIVSAFVGGFTLMFLLKFIRFLIENVYNRNLTHDYVVFMSDYNVDTIIFILGFLFFLFYDITKLIPNLRLINL